MKAANTETAAAPSAKKGFFISGLESGSEVTGQAAVVSRNVAASRTESHTSHWSFATGRAAPTRTIGTTSPSMNRSSNPALW